MNREAFEWFLSEEIGEVTCNTNRVSANAPAAGVRYAYHVVQPWDPSYAGRSFYLSDSPQDGIEIGLYGASGGKLFTVSHIYHWADAYELLALRLKESESSWHNSADGYDALVYRKRRERMAEQSWEMDLKQVEDTALQTALELVKYGFIDDIQFGSESEPAERSVYVHGAVNCHMPPDQVLEKVRQRFEELPDREEKGVYLKWRIQQCNAKTMCTGADQKCGQSFCALWLCGYLEYLVRCGRLDEVLKSREEEKRRGPYAFVWPEKDWLKTVDENGYQLALQMVKSGSVSVGTKLSPANEVLINYPTPCFNKKELITARYLAEQTSAYRSKGERPCETAVPIRSDSTRQGCEHCVMRDRCVRVIAGYLCYLQQTHQRQKIEEDRNWYRQHLSEAEEPLRGNRLFAFQLATNAFLDEAEDMFSLAELLQEQSFVSLRTAQEYDEDTYAPWYVIETTSDVMRYTDVQKLRKDINTGKVGYTLALWPVSTIYDESGDPVKKAVVMAAYVDYLRRTGQYAAYRKQLEEHRRHKLEALIAQQEHPEALRRILSMASDESESSLYCVIQGERGSGRSELIAAIAECLRRAEKIGPGTDYCTCKDLESDIPGQFDLSDGDIDPNPDEDTHIIRRHKLYVLHGLQAFTQERDSSQDKENLIEMLGQYQPETFIIVVGEEKYAQQFLNLSPQIRFLFGGNVITMGEPTPEKLFEIFVAKAPENVQRQLEDNIQWFKERFCEYVEMNRRLLPLKNRELAEYLADYVSHEGSLILPPDVYRNRTAKEMLSKVIGMESVKRKTEEFEQYAIFLKRASVRGMSMPNSSLHMIFTGSPGTGKTMVARVIGQMLYDMGLVKENKVLEVEAKDLKASYVGQSAPKTAGVIDKAMGGVLFIDEAYGIGTDAFAKEVIATLIKAMEDHRDNLVVIFAGYEKEMQEFLGLNPGIASRIGYTFHFDDYSPEELRDIFDVKMTAAGFTYDRETILPRVRDICAFFSRKKDFGNGRFVDRLVQAVILRHSQRSIPAEQIQEITLEDIPREEELASTDVIHREDYRTRLDEVIGMAQVKEKLKEFEQVMAFRTAAEEHGLKLPNSNMHMLFIGNPGTGKTTIARIMVDILYDIDILKENKLIECERKDLVAAYVGQTAQKAGAVIERAMGGVLFIDEAYTLTPHAANDFGGEAIATLIKAMEDHKDDLIVIFAGYESEMQEFVDSNPGIASRIGFTFRFEDYNAEELSQIFVRKMEASGFTIPTEARQRLEPLMQYFSSVKNFGNGRFVDKVIQTVLARHAASCTPETVEVIGEEDIPEIRDMAETIDPTGRLVTPESVGDEDRRRVAIHECGHAIVQKILFPQSWIQKITIRAEGNGALGYVQHVSNFGMQNTRTDYIHSIAVLMAGLAAEKVLTGDYADGGSSDIRTAVARANAMITRFGMSKHGFAGAGSAEENNREVNELLKDAFDSASQIIEAHRDKLECMMELLLKGEDLTDQQVSALFEP